MRTGIDCKGRKWEEMPLKTARNLEGIKYNYLTGICRVVAPEGKSGTWWLFKCDCGNEVVYRYNAVTSGSTVSCGCYKKTVNLKDLTGRRYGKLVVLARDIEKAKWKCQCDCGNIVYISTTGLDCGTSSCGCLRGIQSHIYAEKYNLVGQKFGYLTVVERVASDANGKAYYKCICDCGNETIAQACALRSGQRCSCGKCKHRMS